MKVLLTAFEGYNNSSNVVLDRITGENIIRICLPNDFEKSAELLISCIELYGPDYIISMGRKPQIKRLYIEPVAQRNGEILRTDFDIDKWMGMFQEQHISVKLSDKPSNYLCNHVYFEGLNYIKRNHLNSKMIFLHTPDMKNFKEIDEVISCLNGLMKEGRIKDELL